MSRCYYSVSLRIIMQSRPILPSAKKDVLPTLYKSNVIYHYSCHCDSEYVGRTSQRFHLRRDQHVPNNIRKWMQDLDSRKPSANYFTAIGDHLLSNEECAKNYRDDMFSILARGRNQFHLKTLESLFIQTMNPNLCVQKQYVYKTILFKMLL